MPMFGPASALGISFSVLLVIGGVSCVRSDHQDRVAEAHASAATAARVHQIQVDQAAAIRLTAQATAYAAGRRQEALNVAHTALDSANAAVVAATDMITAETITPLLDAATQLSELVQQAPEPATVIAATTRHPTPSSSPGTTTTTASTKTPSEAAPATTTPATAPTPEATANGTKSPQSAPTALQVTPVEALNLETSAQLVQIADEVTLLSQQIAAATDIAAAERAAAELAAAEAAAAAQATAEEAAAALAQKIALADAAPNGHIPADLMCGVLFADDILLRCDAAPALEQLNAAYKAEYGQDLAVVSTYRDFDTQIITKQTRGNLAATPGTSNHGRGIAVDFAGFGSVGQFDDLTYVWMTQNAESFGWGHPSYMDPGGSGPLEPWHWEYITD